MSETYGYPFDGTNNDIFRQIGPKDIVGLTVKGIGFHEGNDYLVISFTDDTFVIFSADNDYDGNAGISHEMLRIYDIIYRVHKTMAQARVISEDKWEKLYKDLLILSRKSEQDRRKERDKAEYERLKKIFEKEETIDV